MIDKRILFVVAHPDDDILGAGASISKWNENGAKVSTLIFNSEDYTRCPIGSTKLKSDINVSANIVGVEKVFVKGYRDSEFHNESHRQMVVDIENAIRDVRPNIVITHSPADINTDHYWCSRSCQEAVRYSMRQRYESDDIDAFYFMEVLSSTDWYSDLSHNPFIPNTFFEVNEKHLDKKIEALKCFDEVLRKEPHTRTESNIFSIARYRGAQSGYMYAEAFQQVWRRGL